MTPEEEAREIATKILNHGFHGHGNGVTTEHQLITKAIASALTRARNQALEEAAKVADDYADIAQDAHKCAHCDDGPEAGTQIATAIRSLKTPEPK